jgi:hypothetical protein
VRGLAILIIFKSCFPKGNPCNLFSKNFLGHVSDQNKTVSKQKLQKFAKQKFDFFNCFQFFPFFSFKHFFFNFHIKKKQKNNLKMDFWKKIDAPTPVTLLQSIFVSEAVRISTATSPYCSSCAPALASNTETSHLHLRHDTLQQRHFCTPKKAVLFAG